MGLNLPGIRKAAHWILFLIIFISPAVSTCTNPLPAAGPIPDRTFSSGTEDIVITLERTLCFATCPAYTVTIYGNGTVIHEGKSHVKIKGRQTSAISREKVKELISEFEKIKYFSLRDSYETHHVTDFPYAITAIRMHGKEKTIRHYGADRTAPQELHDLEKKIDEIAGTEKWIKGIPEQRVTPGGS